MAYNLGVAISNHNRRRKFEFHGWNEELAYLAGAYLGDGSVCHTKTIKGHYRGNSYFQISSIDNDFIQRVQDCAEKIFPNYNAEIKHDHTRKMNQYRIFSSDFANWIERITKIKEIIPKGIENQNREITIAFLEGLMDSEGCVSRHKDDGYDSGYGYTLDFATSSLWTFQIQELFGKIGVKTGKMIIGIWNNPMNPNCVMFRFYINIYGFYTAGIKFSIARKQGIIEEYIKQRKPKIMRPQRLADTTTEHF
jgi:intein/homing endonuclease